MTRSDSPRYASIVALALSVVLVSMIVVGFGSVSVHGFLWNVDQADNIQIGSEEEQTISGIDIYSEEHPVTVDVGTLVEAGAEFDSNASAYDVNNGQNAEDSEVFIRNPNTSEATIVVSSSALDSTNSFDIKISNINTTGVTKYNNNLSTVDRDLVYTLEQDGYNETVSFDVQFPVDVFIPSDPYNDTSGNLSFEATGFNNTTSSHVVVWNRTSDGDLGRRLGSARIDQESVNITNQNVGGETDIALTAHPGNSDSNINIVHAADNKSVIIPISIQITQRPTYYTNQSSQLDTVVFPLNTNLNTSKGNISVKFYNSSLTTIELGKDSNQYNLYQNQLNIYPRINSNTSDSGRLPHIEKIYITDLVARSGGDTLSNQKYSPRRLGTSVYNNTSKTISQGESVAISNNPGPISINLESGNESVTPRQTTTNIAVFNTTNRSTGTYVINSNNSINGTQLEVLNSSISPDIPDATTLGNLSIQFDSNRNNRHIIANTSNQNSTQYDKSEFILSRTTNTTVQLNTSETGIYHLNLTDIDSGDTVTHSTRVLEQKYARIQLSSNDTPLYLGGKVDIRVSETYSQSVIEMTNLDDPSTNATIELATSGESVSSVGFNTYAAGNDSSIDDLVTTGSGTTVESIATSTPNGTLPPGTYEVAVHSEDGTATTTDTTTVTLHGRSTNDVVAYTTDQESPSELGSADAIRNATADGTLSPSSTVSANETVVYAVNATGLTGLPATRNVTLDTGAELDRFDGLSFGVRLTSGANDTELATTTDDESIGSVPNESSVHVDETGLYVVSDGDDALATNGSPSDGEEYTAAFRVDDERLRDASTDGSDGHTVATAVTYVEPDTGGDQSGDDTDDTTDGDGGTGDDGGTGGSGTESDGGTGGSSGTDGGGGSGGGTGGGGGSGGGTGGGGGSAGSGAAGGGTPADDPPTGRTGGNGLDGTPAHSSRPEDDFGVNPVADLRVSYRDRPNATVNPPSGGIGVDGPAGGNANRPDDATAGSDPGQSGRTTGGGPPDGTASEEATPDEAASDEAPPDEAPPDEPLGPGETAESDGSFADPDAPGYDDAPIRSTAYDLPGFGPIPTLVAFAVVGLIAARRRTGAP